MILLIDDNKHIYGRKINATKEELKNFKNAVWYEGEFSFFDGEEKEDKIKIFTWDGEKIIIEYADKEPQPEPTEEEIIQGEMLLNQAQIMATQQEQDEVLAAILLNQMEV